MPSQVGGNDGGISRQPIWLCVPTPALHASPMRQRSTPVDGSGTTRGATSAPSPAAALSTDQAVRSGVSQRRLPRPGHLALARADLHHFCFSSTATLLRE